MNDLTDDEKKRLAAVATEQIMPIAARYELDNELGISALIEAFQMGIKFIIHAEKEIRKKIEEEIKYGDGA